MSAPLTAAYDRGPSPYFHGREKVRRDFKKLLERAHASKTGTTFLIHGAPGAGKSALLHECMKMAKATDWKVAVIDPPALWDVSALVNSLGLRKELSIEGGEAELSIPGFASAKVSAERSPDTIKRLLQKGEAPLLLILDEAQRLGGTNVPEGIEKSMAANVLNAIHNGQLNKPVVLLAAGLNPTLKAFQTLDISRFGRNCVVELGALSKESERLVIEDWLIKEGRGQGDPSAWMDAIAQETHGWPQHIQCYAGLASEYLQANSGVMTPDGLSSVLEAGHEARRVYYKQRVSGFRVDQIRCLTRSIAEVSPETPAEYKTIISSLRQEYGQSNAEDIFQKFEEKGILEQNDLGYIVSIPSMHNWLTETYTREKIELPREPQKSRVERGRGSGFER